MANEMLYPPSQMGRFVFSRRHALAHEPLPRDFPSEYKAKLSASGQLSRADLANIAMECERRSGVPEDQWVDITTSDVDRIERNEGGIHKNKIHWILKALLLTDQECDALESDLQFLSDASNPNLGNAHLIHPTLRDSVVSSEFGPSVVQAMSAAGRRTTWVDVIYAGDGGFSEEELDLFVDKKPDCIRPSDREFVRVADMLARSWKQKAKKLKPNTINNADNPSIAISAIRVTRLGDEERPRLSMRFVRSRYRYNSAAKGPEGGQVRWRALQKLIDVYAPQVHMTSGIGVAVNVMCARDNKVAVCRRKKVNFRPGEFDVGAVEGIRPTANVDGRTGRLDLPGVVDRALDEEIGLKNSSDVINRSRESLIVKKIIFGFGVDLKYYQYNFLALCVLDIRHEELKKLWTSASDKHESENFFSVDYNIEAVNQFIEGHHIWSSGMAAMINSFKYFQPRQAELLKD